MNDKDLEAASGKDLEAVSEEVPGAPAAGVPSLTVGQLLREARESRNLGRERLAEDLKLPLRHLAAMEEDRWEDLPPGRGRPLARQIAARLGMDLDHHPDALGLLPGAVEETPPDPRLERLERIMMGALTLGSVGLLAWLLVPGRQLRAAGKETPWVVPAKGPSVPPPPPPASGPYPVLGELLPEAPRNAEGVLLSLRAQDVCEATVDADGLHQVRTLQVSEPWKLRVKGAFTLTLSNAGVVQVEAAGAAVEHGAGVGEAWTGRFDAEGRWLRPAPPQVPEGPRTQEAAPEAEAPEAQDPKPE